MKNIVSRYRLLVACLALMTLVGCSDRSEQSPSAEVAKVTEPAPVPYEPQEGDIVIPLKYRGLSGTQEDIAYGWSMGMGQSEQSTEFLKQVREKSPDIISVYNSRFKGAEWSGVEVTDGTPSRLFLDLNANSQLDANESIAPLQSDAQRTTFLTPDFYVQGDDGVRRLFRVLMIASTYDPNSPPSCMWQPANVLEGDVTLEGKAQKMLLFSGDLDGRFDRFGNSRVALVDANEPIKGSVSYQTLSRMISQGGSYYKVFMQPGDQDFNKAQIALRRYEGDLGEIAVSLPDQTGIQLKLRSLKIVGHEDSGLVMNIQDNQAELPIGTYELRSGTLVYGQENTKDWQVQFDSSQIVTIQAHETATVSLSKPSLAIQAVDYNKRYNSDEKPGTVFKQGTVIYVTSNLTGHTGEVFNRLYRNDQDRPYQSVLPHLTITDATGKELVATDLEYG